ncbi:MAG: hypothetical protein ACRET2_11595, partial [Steroidobacteraceae bacterium]
MSSLPPDAPTFTASDVLSPEVWMGRPTLPTLGVDVACTKIAVDLQNLRPESANASILHSLEALAEVTASDCAFVALVGAD